MGARSISLLGVGFGGLGFVLAFLNLYLDGTRLPQVHGGSLPSEFWVWTGLGTAASLALFFGTFVLLRKARLLEDMPTSRIRSAAQGYVELQGYARLLAGPPVVSPLSRQRCAWWSYCIRSYDASSRRWEVIEREISSELFMLADATGSCIVDPEGAQVTPSVSRNWRGRKRRPDMIPKKTEWIGFGNYAYSEQQILVGDMLYATGQFRTQSAILELDEAREVSDLLGQWKRDQRELLQRFDANQDGRIDLEEWEAARRSAIAQVRAEQVQQTLDPDIHVLSRPQDRRPFILSTKTQDQLTFGYRAAALLCLLSSVLLGAAVFYALDHEALLR